MANEIIVTVRARNATKPVFDEVREDAKNLGAEIGDEVSENAAQGAERTVGRNRARYERVGDDIGRAMGERISSRISERVSSRVERWRTQPRDDRGRFTSGAASGGIPSKNNAADDFVSGARSIGMAAGDKMADGLSASLGTFFTSTLGVIVMAGITTLTALVVPAIASAIASGLLLALGGGVIALGIAAALRDPVIAGAAEELGAKFGELFSKFGEAFRGPLATVMERIAAFLTEIEPVVLHLAEVFAPIVEQLGISLVGALQNAIPGIVEAIEAAAPLLETLANKMPAIGQAVGDFFRYIADSGPEANQFFADLLDLIIWIIPKIGRLIEVIADWYGFTRRGIKAIIGFFGDLWDAIRSGISRARGFLRTLLNSVNAVINPIQSIVDRLNGIRSKSVTVTIRQVFRTIGQKIGDFVTGNASGGIVGAATGGIHSGLRWVGEQGPELVKLPTGTTVHSAGDSQRMMRSGFGAPSAGVVARFEKSGNAVLDDLAEWMLGRLRFETRTTGAGSVQQLLGAN